MLRDQEARLDLRPGGVLDEAALAERLDVSRTLVREATIQLFAEGRVLCDSRRAKVASVDFDGIL
ncbi:MAG: GntR family transcriptional regulator [Pseudomonadota bacterium]